MQKAGPRECMRNMYYKVLHAGRPTYLIYLLKISAICMFEEQF